MVEPKKSVETNTKVDGNNPKEKERKKYSKGLKNPQKMEKRLSKAVHKVAKAVDKGLSTYLDKRQKSEDKKKDGAFVDGFLNLSKGISEAASEGSPIIYDVAKAVNLLGLPKKERKRMRKQFGSGFRFLTSPLKN